MLGPLGAAGAPISPTFSAVSMSVTFGATLKITMQTKLRDDMTGGGGGGGGRKGKLSLCGNFLCFDVAPVRGRLHVRIRTNWRTNRCTIWCQRWIAIEFGIDFFRNVFTNGCNGCMIEN
jgi:hypothetical protein